MRRPLIALAVLLFLASPAGAVTVSPTITTPGGGVLKVVWASVNGGDTAVAVPSTLWPSKSVQMQGTITTATLEGSNDDTNWTTLVSFTASTLKSVPIHTQSIRPVITTGTAVTVTVLMLQGGGGGASATVSGSVDQGTPASTANRWPVQVTDGTTLATVDAGSTALKVYLAGSAAAWDAMAGPAVTDDGDIPGAVTSVPEVVAVQYGGAVSHGATPTSVAAAARAVQPVNRAGIPFVLGGHPNLASGEWTYTTAPSASTALVTVSAGTKIIVTKATAISGADMTVNVSVRIGCAAATLTSAGTSEVSRMALSHPNIPPGGGVSNGSGAGIIAVCADGEDLRITTGTITTGSVVILVNYFTIAES